MNTISASIRTVEGTSMPIIRMTYLELDSLGERGLGQVSLMKAYEANYAGIEKMPANLYSDFLKAGKKTKKILKEQACTSGGGYIEFDGGIKLNFLQSIQEDELNFQRLAALMSFHQTFQLENPITSTSMSRCIQVSSFKDSRLKDKFLNMICPGYGYLYRFMFMDKKSDGTYMITPMVNDKPRFMVGAVVMDWLQYSRVNDIAITLKNFAKERMYVTMAGTIAAIMKNSGEAAFDLNEDEVTFLKEQLSLDILPYSK